MKWRVILMALTVVLLATTVQAKGPRGGPVRALKPYPAPIETGPPGVKVNWQIRDGSCAVEVLTWNPSAGSVLVTVVEARYYWGDSLQQWHGIREEVNQLLGPGQKWYWIQDVPCVCDPGGEAIAQLQWKWTD